jgi:hypothetical protein
MTGRKKIIGFGFDPLESQHHFLVVIPRGNDGKVVIYERFKWQEDVQVQIIDYMIRQAKS